MPRCEFCCKKAGLNLIECKSCKNQLCTRCIDMSVHKCEQLEKYKVEKRKLLEEYLLANKTFENKRLST